MTYNVKSIMKRAWEIKSIDSSYFFGMCLKMAWDEAKNNVKLFHTDFVTARGADVSVTVEVEHITSKMNYNDGWSYIKPCSEYCYKVTEAIYNGENKQGAEFFDFQRTIVKIGMVGNRPLVIKLPDDFTSDFLRQEREESKARRARQEAADAKYEAHCAMMRRAMGM